jgi:hypothetical protein
LDLDPAGIIESMSGSESVAGSGSGILPGIMDKLHLGQVHTVVVGLQDLLELNQNEFNIVKHTAGSIAIRRCKCLTLFLTTFTRK